MDDDAWSMFVGRFREPVVRFGLGLGRSESEAQDMAQETFLTFVEALRSGRYDRDRGRLSSWLYGIARNKLRRMGSARESLTHVDHLQESELRRRWDESWERALLVECLDRLRHEIGEAQFSAFLSLSLRERTGEEIASALGVTPNALYVTKHRIALRLKELRTELEAV